MPTSVASVHQPQGATGSPTTSSIGTDNKQDKKPTVLETHGYFLGRTIGTGSYATVRVAKSTKHQDADVAIKIISKFSAPQDYLKKFLPREIEVVKGLRHPNLVRFLQAIETTHRVYIVMEYAENGSLLDIIRKDQYIDETRARKWFRQLVDGVDYCHERGVVHRDIKCENLLMDSGWNIKLSDFGFARGHVRPKNGHIPLSETFCGSYAYASPEILKGIPYQPQFADIWSMGVVLFAMVFGRLPFDDSNYKELIKQVSNKVVFPREPKVSTNCKFLITKILAPLKSRSRMNAVRADPWFNYGLEGEQNRPGTSRESNSSHRKMSKEISVKPNVKEHAPKEHTVKDKHETAKSKPRKSADESTEPKKKIFYEKELAIQENSKADHKKESKDRNTESPQRSKL